MEKICAYVAVMPKAERKRLAKQKRGCLDCGFLDMKSHRCAIYPVRPWVCGAFGRVKGMQCPKLSGLVKIIPSYLEEEELKTECAGGVVGVSSQFDWSDWTNV